LQVLRDVAEVETHLVMSQAARQTLSRNRSLPARCSGAGGCGSRCP
jgi:4-hydroxy-3-polyprenylbenzoate decarboxylase